VSEDGSCEKCPHTKMVKEKSSGRCGGGLRKPESIVPSRYTLVSDFWRDPGGCVGSQSFSASGREDDAMRIAFRDDQLSQ